MSLSLDGLGRVVRVVRVDPDHEPLAIDLGQLDLVRTYEPDADHVDCVASKQVVREEKLAGTPLETPEVQPRSVVTDLSPLDACDLVHRDEQVPALYTHHCTGDRRVGALSDSHYEVLDPADGFTLRVYERSLDQARQVHQRRWKVDLLRARRPGHG